MGIILLKIGSVVFALFIFLRVKINLAFSILLLSAYTVFLFHVNFKTAFVSSFQVLIEERTIQLFIIIMAVLYIGAIQKSAKMFDKLINSLNSIIKDKRIVAMVSPAIIGFLPMPGGALFSAPLVDVSTKKMHLKPEFNTFINFWFRHLWEFIWPIYVGLLVFQTLSQIPLKKIILFQSPFTILNISTGLIVSFIYFKKHNIRPLSPKVNIPFSKTIKDFIAGIWPVLLVILLFFIFSVPLYLSLVIVSIILTLVLRLKIKEFSEVLFSKFVLKNLILIASVMIFQRIITISNVFETLQEEDISFVMVIFISFLISFIMGFLTGVNQAFVAIAYPVLFPLFANLPNAFFISLYIYVVGFAGVLLSPVHLCLVLTNEYFNSSLIKVYKYLAFPVITLIAVATLLVFLI